MKFCAIICEFNPLHNGHKYIIEQAKKQTGLPILCMMSGNFCQRAELAILKKEIRAKHAIEAGADAVIELPVPFAFNNAEMFAYSAINLLKNLDCVEYLCFGSESGNLNELTSLANIMIDKKEEIDNVLQPLLKTGKSYPACFQIALQKCLNKNIDILNNANDILAIEYLKQIELQKANIKPIAIKRIGEDFKSETISNLSSSSAIRTAIEDGNFNAIKNSVPEYVFKDLQSFKKPTFFKDYELLKLRTTTAENLQKIYDSGNDGIVFRLKKFETEQTIDETIEKAKAKAFSHNRLRRVVLNNALNITTDFFENCKQTPLFANVLAVKDNSVLSSFKNATVPIIYTKRDLNKLTTEQKTVYNLFKLCDILSSIAHHKQ